MLSRILSSRIFVSSLYMAIIIGSSLLLVNTYGLFVDLRKDNLHELEPKFLRFSNEDNYSYTQSLEEIERIQGDQDLQYALKANDIVNKSLSHIKWPHVDRVEFRQLIPIWENFFLFFLGIFYDDAQIQRYHYVDYKRSIERGIGICGDSSLVLSQVLDKKRIENNIVSFGGHVITEATLEGDKNVILDPDFGVVIDLGLEELLENPSEAKQYYIDAGYSQREANTLVNSYSGKYTVFDSVFDFMPRRYIFEYMSYILKWLLPLLLVAIPTYLLVRRRTMDASSQSEQLNVVETNS